jgi:hypothetical protein
LPVQLADLPLEFLDITDCPLSVPPAEAIQVQFMATKEQVKPVLDFLRDLAHSE